MVKVHPGLPKQLGPVSEWTWDPGGCPVVSGGSGILAPDPLGPVQVWAFADQIQPTDV